MGVAVLPAACLFSHPLGECGSGTAIESATATFAREPHGALIALPVLWDLYRRAAPHIDRILRGEKPDNLQGSH
jgi:hypothetical protein